jgi:hypothetical protein
MTRTTTPADQHPDNPRRRQLLQGLALALGAGTAAQLAGGNALSTAMAFAPRADLAAAGELFNAPQMAALRTICDLVIPATEIPGAAEMDTHGFIDRQLKMVHAQSDQERAMRVLTSLDAAALKADGMDWNALAPERQLGLLDALDRGQRPFDGGQRADFKFLKGLVLFGYFTSEAGASMALKFDPVPGGFTGSIPYADVGKAWGPGGLY